MTQFKIKSEQNSYFYFEHSSQFKLLVCGNFFLADPQYQ